MELSPPTNLTVHKLNEIPSLKNTKISVDKVRVRDFYEAGRKALHLEIVAGKNFLDNEIGEKVINRPALALTGYYKQFAARRLQIFGGGEISYLNDLGEESQRRVLETFFQTGVPAIVVSRDLLPTGTMCELAEKYHVPILRSRENAFVNNATVVLNELFAPHATLHATLIDVGGVGVLLCGDSGAGKSECALSIIASGRGALVADDYVIVRLVDEKRLIGSSKDIGFGFMECRGIGIINVANMFGIRAVLKEKQVDLVISISDWEEGMDEERTGLDQDVIEILGKQVPWIRFAARPGRDISRLVNVAAMVHALRAEGYNSARDFNNGLIAHNIEHK